MASLPGAIFDLVEGNPVGKEQDEFGGLASYNTGVGEGLTTAGAGEELGILSGDPSRIAQVEAPEINAQQGQIEQQRLQNANFSNRSGGTNASTQNAEGAGRANIIDLTGNLINNTAGTAVNQGSNLISQASSDIGHQADLATKNREREVGDIGGITKDAAQIASAFFPKQDQDDASQNQNPTVDDIVGKPMPDPQAGVGPQPADIDPSGLGGPPPDFSDFT